jgi:hypothetical protein
VNVHKKVINHQFKSSILDSRRIFQQLHLISSLICPLLYNFIRFIIAFTNDIFNIHYNNNHQSSLVKVISIQALHTNNAIFHELDRFYEWKIVARISNWIMVCFHPLQKEFIANKTQFGIHHHFWCWIVIAINSFVIVDQSRVESWDRKLNIGAVELSSEFLKWIDNTIQYHCGLLY